MNTYVASALFPLAVFFVVMGIGAWVCWAVAPFLADLAAVPGFAQKVANRGLLRATVDAIWRQWSHHETRTQAVNASDIFTRGFLGWLTLLIWIAMLEFPNIAIFARSAEPSGAAVLGVAFIGAVITMAMLMKDTLSCAASGGVRVRSITRLQNTPGRRLSESSPRRRGQNYTLLKWPANLVHVSDRRAYVAVARLTVLYRSLSVLTAAVLTLTFIYTLEAHGGIPSGPQAVQGIESLALSWVAATFVWDRGYIPVRGLRLQLDILRALAVKPVERKVYGWFDPLGSHRPALYGIARDLRSEAHRVERQTTGGAPHPYSILLRGVARAIDSALTGRESVQDTLPAELDEILTYAVAVIAGPRDNTVRVHLAKLVRAFNDDGSPDPALVVATPGLIRRMGSRLYATVDRTSSFLKALSIIALFVALLVLLSLGRLSAANVPSWKP